MRIIGRTGALYLVTISGDEIARVAGFHSVFNGDFQQAMAAIGALRGGELAEGAEIPVSDLWQRLSDLRRHEQDVKKAAASLRGLADLMDGALPQVVAPAPAGSSSSPAGTTW